MTVCVTYQIDILVVDYVTAVLVSSDDEEDSQVELSQRPTEHIQFEEVHIQFEEVGSGSVVELSQHPLEHIQFEEVHIQFEEVGSGSVVELSQHPLEHIQFEEVGFGGMEELSQRPLEHIQFEEAGSMTAANASLEQTLEWCSGKSYLVGTYAVAARHIDLSAVSS
jgi:hypothetical protein